tara:strand:+ start:1113 stop:1340 length:228 start_codon:yes stop_codon:yes gene_type:complete
MKPVAWINIEDGNSILDWEKDEFAQKHYPLYDHLISELTDEEIDKIIKQHDWYSKTWVDMVRSIESAILKKAREQ